LEFFRVEVCRLCGMILTLELPVTIRAADKRFRLEGTMTGHVGVDFGVR
jgi:hypothetical protein